MLSKKSPNVCCVSMRSKGVNVSRIATGLGGGGHIRAAGELSAEEFNTPSHAAEFAQ